MLSYSEIAAEFDIPVETLKQRLRSYGPDHNLTYYPGKIPPNLRRRGRRSNNGGVRNSKLGEIELNGRDPVTGAVAVEIITCLIKHSMKDWKKRRCKSSKSFLLNENGMLEWYLECMPLEDLDAYLERLRNWVADN